MPGPRARQAGQAGQAGASGRPGDEWGQPNLRTSTTNATGYLGVYEKEGRFQARLGNGRLSKRNLGSYSTAVEAATAIARALQEDGGGG